jgi:hypothetical protein
LLPIFYRLFCSRRGKCEDLTLIGLENEQNNIKCNILQIFYENMFINK